MPDPQISARAYAKIVFHAAKYPHLSVNGLLLASKSDKTHIVDVVPLFHQCLHVTPMAEVALIQIEAKVAEQQLQIVGYYAAAENFNENSIDRMPGMRVAEKVAETVAPSFIVVVDNRMMAMDQRYPAIRVWQHAAEGGKWLKAKFSLVDKQTTLDSVSLLLQRGAMKQLNDFDNWLDNTANDWQNVALNKDLDQILAMD